MIHKLPHLCQVSACLLKGLVQHVGGLLLHTQRVTQHLGVDAQQASHQRINRLVRATERVGHNDLQQAATAAAVALLKR
jgi:hypothetical protein